MNNYSTSRAEILSQAAQIKELLKRGLSSREIVTLMPTVTMNRVWRARVRLKMPKLKRGRKQGSSNTDTAKRADKARKLKALGLSYSKIGKELGVTPQAVVKYLRFKPKTRAEFCSRCGKPQTTGNLIHYHHTDYSNNVAIPVCGVCHALIETNSKRDVFVSMFSGRKVLDYEELSAAISAPESTHREWCRWAGILLVRASSKRRKKSMIEELDALEGFQDSEPEESV